MHKSVFVIGAGASCEVDLPTGARLRTELAADLNIRFAEYGERATGDPVLAIAIRLEHQNRKTESKTRGQSLVHAAWRIRDAMPLVRSIDQYIDQHRDDADVQLCGKLGIVHTILKAEQSSKLYVDPTNTRNTIPFKDVGSTWFSGWWQLISEGCDVAQLVERLEAVSLIVFNYDRCVEHFLYHAIQGTYYELSPEQVAGLVQLVRIYHPYGTVGVLPWQGGVHRMIFGGQPQPAELLRLAAEVKTFSESVGSEQIAGMHERLREANTIVYLGFAFHRQNLELLWPPHVKPSRADLQIGSAFEISEVSASFIRHRIAALSGTAYEDVRLYDLKCAKFFDHNWYQLNERLAGR